jgi:VWFA-related protein
MSRPVPMKLGWRPLLVAALGVAFSIGSSAQGPVFRSSTALVAVDVQVVADDGTPVPTLTKDDFRVSIDKKSRTVANATFLAYNSGTRASAELTAPAQADPVAPATDADDREGRTFIIAFDLLTFDVGASRLIAGAARDFVDTLGPRDRVGVFPYPLGRRVEPTTDRIPALRSIDTVLGQRPSAMSRSFFLSSADIVDWWAGENERIVLRECGGAAPVGGFAVGTGRANANCVSELQTEVGSRTQEFETAGMLSIGMLRGLFEELGRTPGRKYVVLVSGGMPLSDRPGGRPDGGTSGQELGVLAARANVGLYSLYFDRSFFDRASAANRTPNHTPVNLERESMVQGQWLGMLASGAGGALMRIIVGDSRSSFARVLKETSSYYLLGVEPLASDQAGRPQAIQVTVNKRGLTVRSRRWVVMPRL